MAHDKKIFVVDAMGYIFRSFHAIRNMTSSKGEPTNALYGFVRSLLKLQKDFNPEYLVAVFDGEDNSKSRTALYADYKANRTSAPDALIPQFAAVEEFLLLSGIPTLRLSGVEADDTMGTIAKIFTEHDFEVILCSTDKDLAQLVSPHVKMLNTFKENLLIDEAEVEKIYGVRPDQIKDYLAIVGDASDNVPGVPGIGPKGATELLKQFGTLDAILENASSIKGKKGESLTQFKDLALLSRQLVTLDLALPIPLEKDFYIPRLTDPKRLFAFFQDKDFKSLAQEVSIEKETSKANYTLINSEEDLEKLATALSSAPILCVDTIVIGEDPQTAKLVGIALSIAEEAAYYIPLNGALAQEKIKQTLRPIFQKIPSFGHNIKFDMHVLKREGIPLENIAFDTMVASYLIQADERQHSLDRLIFKEFEKVKAPLEELVGKGKQQITLFDVPLDKMCAYFCEDVDYTFRLYNLYAEQLKTRNLQNLFIDVELPLIHVLADMEERGVFVDRSDLKKLLDFVQKDLKILQDKIFAFAGEEFNLNSPKQLGEILFTKLQIRPPKKIATGFSTNADVLEALAPHYPIAESILSYRTLEKLRSTYIESLPDQINLETDRIHCTFNQSVAATGRLSSQNPNLQNIPVRTTLGREIRAAFKPQKEGWSFVAGDYSQIELRLLAHFSEDAKLLEIFLSGLDIHTATAASIFEVPLDQVTPEMRYRAKAVNFGILYGQQAWGLSQELHIDPKEAGTFIERYFLKYPQVKNYLEHMKQEARIHKATKTLIGRERRLPDILSTNQMVRQAQERLAVNTPLQGTNADLIKMAMIELQNEIKKRNLQGFMILQIHDELIFEVPDHEIPIFEKLVKELMENVASLKVPLIVNVGVGKNWKEC